MEHPAPDLDVSGEQKKEELLIMSGKCPVCGAPMGSSVCDYCGYKEKQTISIPPGSDVYVNYQSTQQYVQQNNTYPNMQNHRQPVTYVSLKKKSVALILCILLGWAGAHKFYVGKMGMGLIYLFTFGLFGIGWLVDILLIASGTFRDQFGLQLKM